MKNVKAKTKINEREITITLYADGEEVEKLVRYHNSCMICKEETINTEDFGEEYICPSCAEWLKTKLGTSNSVEDKPKKKRAKVYNRTLTVTKEYHPNIKIVDFVGYSNLMTHHKVNEKLATTIIDLILKGVNTPIKIHKILNQYKLDCLCIYLAVMSKVGMLQPMPFERAKGNKYDRIFKIHKNLLYTSVE